MLNEEIDKWFFQKITVTVGHSDIRKMKECVKGDGRGCSP